MLQERALSRVQPTEDTAVQPLYRRGASAGRLTTPPITIRTTEFQSCQILFCSRNIFIVYLYYVASSSQPCLERCQCEAGTRDQGCQYPLPPGGGGRPRLGLVLHRGQGGGVGAREGGQRVAGVRLVAGPNDARRCEGDMS